MEEAIAKTLTFPAESADALGQARPGVVVDALMAVVGALPQIGPTDLNRTIALSFVNPVPVEAELTAKAWGHVLPHKPVHRLQVEIFDAEDQLLVRAHLTVRNAKKD